MIYKFTYAEAVLEFAQNRGRIFLEADSPEAAIRLARNTFRYTRDESVSGLGEGQYLVSFKVSLNYRLSLIHTIDRAVKLIRTFEAYTRARFIERYIVATIYRQTKKPTWLKIDDLPEEIGTLRKAAVVAREVASVIRFLDWDICIANYMELNSKPGHKSRVVRKPRAAVPRPNSELTMTARTKSHSSSSHTRLSRRVSATHRH